MSEWTSDELTKIAEAEELQIAPVRRDGTLRKAGDDLGRSARRRPLYVRSWRGRTGAWFSGAQDSHEGHISVGGVDKDVRFIEADDSVNDAIDAAYRAKYHRYADSYVTHMIRPEA